MNMQNHQALPPQRGRGGWGKRGGRGNGATFVQEADPIGCRAAGEPQPHPPVTSNNQMAGAGPVLPEGLELIEGFLTPEEHAFFWDFLMRQEWSYDLDRRTQQYGFTFDYPTQAIIPNDKPIPLELRPILERLETRVGVWFNQLIVNEYQPHQGINPHVDKISFGPVVVSISLGERCVMDMKHGRHGSFSLVLEPCSALVLKGPSRYEWTHGIQRKQHWILPGQPPIVRNNVRISLTFRTFPA
eukprot:gnl/Spiro4/10643_TR5691_c0_g1_i1.p1 gnl/Spiro4/10643_TR5691_c0_g1~~gnl/Spiro4/10643_TR5691_c0_g1_i1.p1  ORF type:complete len:262 (-),score=11.73 gnl/Spiro4/10643_TR5691_c0_g1_i1:46-774(-)